MRNLAKLLFLVCLIITTFDVASPSRCYVCTATRGKQKDCEVNVKKVKNANCVSPVDYCMTTISDGKIGRSCGSKNSCVPNKFAYCKVCHEDLCNTDSGAFVPAYSTALVVPLSLFAQIKVLT